MKDTNKNKTTVTIPLEGYKELLIIKGRYEELLKQTPNIINYPVYPTTPTYPYKITCTYIGDEKE